jgi:branched-chain amino acid transport system ATP-binding protein
MLEVKDLTLHYGRHIALKGASLTVGAGETVVILGANGAGKSSLLKAIAGIAKPDPGSVVSFENAAMTGLPPHEVMGRGIALVPEGRGVFGDLTVEENLALGAYARHARSSAASNLSFVYELFPKLQQRQRQYVNTMSGGEQQMVAIGRALMSKPKLLMLDEPSLGLAPVVVGELFQSLGRIRERGVALLIVEQNVKMSLAIADRGYLAEAGRISNGYAATALMDDVAVQRAFLGATA